MSCSWRVEAICIRVLNDSFNVAKWPQVFGGNGGRAVRGMTFAFISIRPDDDKWTIR